MPVNNPSSFHAEARYQGACANCGKMGGEWEAHHVIELQELKRRGLPQYDTRLALRLCSKDADTCHGGQHTIKRVKMSALTDDNIEVAFEFLGAYAYDYLRSHYEGTDPRVQQKFIECERRFERAVARPAVTQRASVIRSLLH